MKNKTNIYGKYVKKYWKMFACAVSCLTAEAVCDLLQPTIMARIVDVGVAGQNMGYVIRMGAAMIGIAALGAMAAVGRNISSNKVSQRFGMDLRSDLFKKIQSFSFGSINRFETASLVTRLTNDVTQVQNFVNGTMRIFVKAPLLGAGSIVMAVLLNPRMALVLLAVIPIIGLIVFLNSRIGYPFFKKVQYTLDRINGVVREYLSGVRVVKAFNRFSYETERFSRTNTELASITTRAMRIMAVFSPIMTLTVNIGAVAVLGMGGFRVYSGEMKVGEVIAIINYMTQVLFSLMMISFVFTAFVRAKTSSERITEVMTHEDKMACTTCGRAWTGDMKSLEFDNVSFSYTGAPEGLVLRNISFCCRQGETVGIIGPTGSGKSTLVSLIPRFYDVSSGSIRIAGIDIRDMDAKQLKELIAIVPQKTILFTGTIAENIRWGRENASMEEVVKAAQTAQAHKFISSFPEGYDSMLGQGGVNLSGGQKQRISIARALVRKPQILILDDCTSAVDMSTEAAIRKALSDFSERITCFVIAQRITSVMNADRIIVLDNGGMAGMGTHRELMQTCDIYRDIYRSQIGGEDE